MCRDGVLLSLRIMPRDFLRICDYNCTQPRLGVFVVTKILRTLGRVSSGRTGAASLLAGALMVDVPSGAHAVLPVFGFFAGYTAERSVLSGTGWQAAREVPRGGWGCPGRTAPVSMRDTRSGPHLLTEETELQSSGLADVGPCRWPQLGDGGGAVPSSADPLFTKSPHLF